MRWSPERVQIGNAHPLLAYLNSIWFSSPAPLADCRFPPAIDRGDSAPSFEFTVEFFPCKAKLGDGSVRNIERDTRIIWEVKCTDIDPQELQSMEEKAVKNLVERIGESVIWGPEQEVSLLRYDDCMNAYVRIEDGEDMVDEIDRQEGWTSKKATFWAELIDLNQDSRVGYVPSKMASQMADAEWAAEKQMLLPMLPELTVICEDTRAAADAEQGVPQNRDAMMLGRLLLIGMK